MIIGEPYFFTSNKIGTTFTHYFNLEGGIVDLEGVLALDLDPDFFENALTDLDMTYEKFFLATASQKIIYS